MNSYPPSLRISLYVVFFMLGSHLMIPTIINGQSEIKVIKAKFIAALTNNNVLPPNNSTANGLAIFEPLDDEIAYVINLHNTGKITSVHLHGGRSADYGREVIATLQHEERSDTPNRIEMSGKITEYDLTGSLYGKRISDLVDAFATRTVYLDVHTTAFPNGEIRGIIQNSNSSQIGME